VVLFRVLGGQPPFTGNSLALMRAATRAPRPSLHALRPDLPRAIDDWAEHALAIDRERRFSRATAMWNALRTIVG
jgi:serine/threonine-protein kinase